jgi:hypothetical protein
MKRIIIVSFMVFLAGAAGVYADPPSQNPGSKNTAGGRSTALDLKGIGHAQISVQLSNACGAPIPVLGVPGATTPDCYDIIKFDGSDEHKAYMTAYRDQLNETCEDFFKKAKDAPGWVQVVAFEAQAVSVNKGKTIEAFCTKIKKTLDYWSGRVAYINKTRWILYSASEYRPSNPQGNWVSDYSVSQNERISQIIDMAYNEEAANPRWDNLRVEELQGKLEQVSAMLTEPGGFKSRL